jgi:four helix bundle protein
VERQEARRNGEIRDFKDLRVWQYGMDLVDRVYRVTKRFPEDERWALTLQLRRASVSIPANIAEGYGRQMSGNYRYHLGVARGSVREVETLMLIGARLGYVDATQSAEIQGLVDGLSGMLTNLIKAIGSSRR